MLTEIQLTIKKAANGFVITTFRDDTAWKGAVNIAVTQKELKEAVEFFLETVREGFEEKQIPF